MKVQFFVGQVFDHESGQEWQVVRVSELSVTFDTPDGELVRMSIDDAVADIATGTLTPQDGSDDEDEDDDE